MVRISNGGRPLMAKLVDPCCPVNPNKKLGLYRIFILLATFVAYTCYHMSRKPISVVKNEFLQCNGTEEQAKNQTVICTSFITQINGTNFKDAKKLEGWLDTSYLFSYAFFMFLSGIVAERVDLRYFLSAGMILSGIFTMLMGFAKYWGIHDMSWFIVMQVFGGAAQTTGWPGVVTVVANWFGRGKKGLIFGIWNSHTSIGNILGSLLAGVFVEDDWALSFIIPGVIISSMGIIFFFILIPKPELVGLDVSLLTSDENEFADGEESDTNGEETQGTVEKKPKLSCCSVDLKPPQPDLSVVGPIAPGPSVNGTIVPGSFVDDRNAGAVIDTNHRNVLVPGEPEDIEEEHAITFWGALQIPGVIEFSFCLFFAKLVSYTFLFWLPTFIKQAGENISNSDAAFLSTLFDVGGIFGGILAGVLSDVTGKSASTCAIMLILAIPTLFAYESFGSSCPINMLDKSNCYAGNVGLLMFMGLLVNGPYALITTAVSAELGTHPCLRGSAKALATVTSIIDGTGSIGAAIGPFLAGAIDFEKIFYMLMLSDIFALLLLTRLVKRDIQKIIEHRRQRRRNQLYHRHS